MSAKDTTRIRPVTWADKDIHLFKRELSSFEKASLRDTRLAHGHAVIMPAVPHTEIEELMAVGFDPRRIQAVEENEALADALYAYYWDDVQVHIEEIGLFLERSRNDPVKGREGYSYIHLDYCGHLQANQRRGIVAAVDKCAPYSRLRVSVMLSRRQEEQFADETMIIRRVFGGLAEAAFQLEEGAQYRWNDLVRGLEPNLNDSTLTIAAIVLMRAVFGMSVFEYADACVSGGHPFFPPPNGRLRIAGMHRYVYNEPANSNVMATVWFNFAPVIGEPGQPEPALEELAVMLRQLGSPAAPFLNPAQV